VALLPFGIAKMAGVFGNAKSGKLINAPKAATSVPERAQQFHFQAQKSFKINSKNLFLRVHSRAGQRNLQVTVNAIKSFLTPAFPFMNTQLLQNYSENEKTAYLSCIASLATADRQASPAEGQFLQALCQQAGLSAESTQQVAAAAQDSSNESIQQHLDVLKNSDLRYSLITDLISFARTDGSYSNDEEAMVNKMSQYLGINQQQQQTLETVVDQAATVPHDPQDPAKEGFLSSIGDKLSNVGIPKGALMAGLLGVVAPMVLSKVMGGGSNANAGYGNQAGYGDQSSSGGGLGGLLSGSMGGLLGGAAQSGMGGMLGGLLGSVMGGSAGAGVPQQQSAIGSGGLGSIMSVLGGLSGQSNQQSASSGGGGLGGLLSGGMGSLLGGLFGGR
jgi:uncharacterized tellurite resistance protein B-like protein